jgi:hypothetical protein
MTNQPNVKPTYCLSIDLFLPWDVPEFVRIQEFVRQEQLQTGSSKFGTADFVLPLCD